MNPAVLLAESDGLQTAWFGLAGVVIGAVVVGGFSYAVERSEFGRIATYYSVGS